MHDTGGTATKAETPTGNATAWRRKNMTATGVAAPSPADKRKGLGLVLHAFEDRSPADRLGSCNFSVVQDDEAAAGEAALQPVYSISSLKHSSMVADLADLWPAEAPSLLIHWWSGA
jgi:hypothetical protein